MRDGLAREFPEAVRGAAWVRTRIAGRRVAVWSEPVVWATISAIGAGFLVTAVVQAVVGLTSEAIQALRAPTPFPLFPAVTIAGSAATAAAALGAGGLGALALALVYALIGIALRIPSLLAFCERSGNVFPAPGPDQCSAFGFLASYWPQFVGIGLGIVLARTILSTRGEGANSLLRVAGALAIALFAVSAAWGIAFAQAGYVAEPGGAATSALTVAAGIAAAAVAAGALAAQLPRGVRNAAIVAAIWLVPWFALQVPFAMRSLTGPIAEDNVIPIVASIVIEPIAAAFLVLSAALGARSRFVPREPA
ncbi:MAG TPA: hypothetical protein VGR85_14515 [Candidatus Limnocylindria bacterium]|jgi:hypothetical protein|nr:hypothetical protein [Candidatus Limnocylindria bacterium]